MPDKGQISSISCLTFERLLPGPVEKVWAHLTRTELLPAWFGEDSHIEPRRGGAVRLMGGHIRGTVTQWQPPVRLLYSWNVFDPDDPKDAASAYPETYASFELEARGDEVLLRFSHLPIPEPFLARTAMGWHTMLDILEAGLRGEAIEDRSVFMRANAARYGVDLDPRSN